MGTDEITKAESLGITGTKLLIFKAAIDLFYERGYSNVGIRDIADAAGIKSASIYNHFDSKDALLEQIYTFFHDTYFESLPNMEDILALVPTASPYDVFEQMQMPLSNKGMFDILKKIILIFEYEGTNKQRAKDIVSEIFTVNTWRMSTVLEKMVEIGKIEPINVDLFASILVRYTLSAASRIEDLRSLSLSEWRAGNRLLFGLIRTKVEHKTK
jgi:AcrR family transcriptional regulator